MSLDPLNAFEDWSGEALGEDTNEAYGFEGEISTPAHLLGVAAAWATSTELGSGAPGVYVRLIARVVGHQDHVLEAVLHAETARELGVALYSAAERAPLDQAARDLQGEGLL